MAHRSSVFDFSTSCSALRSCDYVHVIALELLDVLWPGDSSRPSPSDSVTDFLKAPEHLISLLF
jgi:hypothetical protein